MTTAVPFSKTSPLAFDKALGLCFGWFCFSKRDGQPYVDAHGDHIPDDELVKAVDGLMAKPASEREINVEHAGGARGSIATAQALTEDIAKALRIDTGGTFGIVGSFRPDPALMKSIESGESFCLSIEGKAHNVETVAKSADGADPVPAGCKRILRAVELTKLAVVKAGAHAGAEVALIKSARKALVAKSTPAMTSAESGHQHLIYDADERSGYTSGEQVPSAPEGGWHAHPWIRRDDGGIEIGEALGHKHTLTIVTTESESEPMPDTTADANKTLAADRDALAELLTKAVTLPPDQIAYAKGMSGDIAKLRAFIALPDAERIAKSTPIYKAADGAVYFAAGEAALAKRLDEQQAEIAKAREERDAVAIEKRAGEALGHVAGDLATKVAVLKAVEGIADQAAREKALALLKTVDTAHATVFRAPGVGVAGVEPAGPQAELDRIAADMRKSDPAMSFAKAFDAALSTPRGRQLYAEIERAKRAPAVA